MKIVKYASIDSAAHGLANVVSAQLKACVREHGMGRIAVPGGRTPKRFLEVLGQADIDWTKIRVTPTDERRVSQDHPRSNARFVREALQVNSSASTSFLALNETEDIQQIQNRFYQDLLPLDVCVFGMGNDGHTASLFPRIGRILDPDWEEPLAAADAPEGLEPRITLTANTLLNTPCLHVLIHGTEKWNVLQTAVSGYDVQEMPICLLLNDASDRLQVHYATE